MVSVLFLSPSRQVFERRPKKGHDRFPAHACQLEKCSYLNSWSQRTFTAGGTAAETATLPVHRQFSEAAERHILKVNYYRRTHCQKTMR
jgi:hypothetical protein